MRVLGIDPGLGRTGVAVVAGRVGNLSLIDAVCVETQPRTEDASRLASLFDQVETLVGKSGADVAAVEELFFATNRTTAMQVAQARGVVLLVLARAGLRVVSYTPPQVKEAVAGYGGARKPQLARMTCRLLGVDKIPGHDDAADACAVAICHHHRAGLGVGMRGHEQSAPSALDRAVLVARARLDGAPS